uniref:Uncharacterized protein n=1 Tax=Rousettus aegyptiacus TaxID=9407 RepID=A0A7J8CIF3_ROUAE|nr:hypothetical protein HJG63_009066 [Rousettus aegyptiacus]
MLRAVCVGTSVAPSVGRTFAVISVLWKVRLGLGRGTCQRGASRRVRHHRPPRVSDPSSTPGLPGTHCHRTRQEASKRFYKSVQLSTRVDSGWKSCVCMRACACGESGGERNSRGAARRHLLKNGPVQPIYNDSESIPSF